MMPELTSEAEAEAAFLLVDHSKTIHLAGIKAVIGQVEFASRTSSGSRVRRRSDARLDARSPRETPRQALLHASHRSDLDCAR
jgi:hypothetical protein